MPASAPKGWFKRWAFGFGRAGWILLGVLGLVLVAHWRGINPVHHVLVLAERAAGPGALDPVSWFLTYGAFACLPNLGIFSAAMLVATAYTSTRRPKLFVSVLILGFGLAWSWESFWFTIARRAGTFAGGPLTASQTVAGLVIVRALSLALVSWVLTRSRWVSIASLAMGFAWPWGFELLYCVLGGPPGPGPPFPPPWLDTYDVGFNLAWHIIITLMMLIWAAGTHRAYRPGDACPSCGYDLTGLSTSKCPECGAEHAPAQSAPSA